MGSSFDIETTPQLTGVILKSLYEPSEFQVHFKSIYRSLSRGDVVEVTNCAFRLSGFVPNETAAESHGQGDSPPKRNAPAAAQVTLPLRLQPYDLTSRIWGLVPRPNRPPSRPGGRSAFRGLRLTPGLQGDQEARNGAENSVQVLERFSAGIHGPPWRSPNGSAAALRIM